MFLVFSLWHVTLWALGLERGFEAAFGFIILLLHLLKHLSPFFNFTHFFTVLLKIKILLFFLITEGFIRDTIHLISWRAFPQIYLSIFLLVLIYTWTFYLRILIIIKRTTGPGFSMMDNLSINFLYIIFISTNVSQMWVFRL